MAAVAQHYATHLAPVYEWLAGGAEHACAQGAADLGPLDGAAELALDLGAGFGMHAVPLARAGYRVVAIDSSARLLTRLRELAVGLSIDVVEGDLREFPAHIPAGQQPRRIVCLGDTLTHLPEESDVARLAQQVARTLAPRGRFLATFRDYSVLPQGEQRFILVRADDTRMLTCFLEELPGSSRVRVHDLLHERTANGWTCKVSSYEKLRLRPADVAALFQAAGLRVALTAGPRGMTQLTADA